MTLQSWVKLPTAWIENRGLRSFRWGPRTGSAGISGLMVLMVLAHRADPDSGEVRVTYDDIVVATGLSRTSVSNGLRALESRCIVAQVPGERSAYQLVGYNPKRAWGKLPARDLYRGSEIRAFRDFHLRRVAELDALKAYLAFVARRDNASNRAMLSYDKIEYYTGIRRNRIKSALSLLAANSLVYVEHMASEENPYGIANAYRIAHIDPRRHMGTSGRRFVRGNEEFPASDGDSPMSFEDILA